MKALVTILALLALAAGVPAFAAPPLATEVALLPASADLSSPTCPAMASAVPGPQNVEVPAWLGAEPLLWTGEPESLTWLSAGCAAYCRTCEGCCAILGPNVCACC